MPHTYIYTMYVPIIWEAQSASNANPLMTAFVLQAGGNLLLHLIAYKLQSNAEYLKFRVSIGRLLPFVIVGSPSKP